MRTKIKNLFELTASVIVLVVAFVIVTVLSAYHDPILDDPGENL